MKVLLVIIVVLMNFFSWFYYLDNSKKNVENYNVYLEKAKEYASKKIYIDSIEYFKKAIKINPQNVENKVQLAIQYRDGQMNSSFEKYCKEINKEHPDNYQIIAMLGDFYLENESPVKAMEWYNSIEKKYRENEVILSKLRDLKYTYKILYNDFEEIYCYYGEYTKFMQNGKWGLVDSEGEIIIAANYDEIGIFDNSENTILAPVKNDNEWFYIDIEENRRLVSDTKYDFMGTFCSSDIAVARKDNKYVYLDKSFKKISKEFEFATDFFQNNVAVVNKNKSWYIINNKMDIIGEIEGEPKFNELQCGIHEGYVVAKNNDGYNIINEDCKTVLKCSVEDMDFPRDEKQPFAIKKNGKWGFSDFEGNIVIEPMYEEAFSFSCGLAPVKINGLWGYVDIEGNLAVEPKFKNARAFGKNGCAPVYTYCWKLLFLNSYLKD